MNILWVEDSFDSVVEIASALHKVGHTLTVVASRSAAITHLDTGWRGEMVMLDSMMPEEDRHYTHSGCDLFKDLRSGRWGDWGRNVRVTFVTAYEDNVHGKIDGLAPKPLVLAKPVDSTEAISRIDQAFPGINIQIHSGNGTAVSVNGNAFAEIRTSSIVLDAEQRNQIAALASELLTQADENAVHAARLLINIADTRNDPKKTDDSIQSFREWVSAAGDEVKEGIITSASLVTIATPLLQLLGLS